MISVTVDNDFTGATFLGIGHLQQADPADVHRLQLSLSHCVPDRKRHQGTVHLGRCPTHQAYWPRYQAMCGMGGSQSGGFELWNGKTMHKKTNANNTKMLVKIIM